VQAGNPEQARRDLEAALELLSKAPGDGTGPLGSMRLKLIEESAVLKATLSAGSPDRDGATEGIEGEAEGEEAPALVNPEEEPTTEPSQGDIGPPRETEIDPSEFDLPIVLNDSVKAYIQFFQTRKREVINRSFERAGRYLPMMREIFLEHGLPLDLVNLAHVESAFNYRAYSRAKAAGIWQFIKSTAHRFNMTVDGWVDQRRDPVVATRAAAAYLKELYAMFNESWPLALAAYNAGEQKVQRAIARQGTDDFWALRLPRETQLFVPAFMAIAIIAKHPERFGFTPPVERPWEVERAVVPGSIHLRSIAQAVGVSYDDLRDLNPALKRSMTPADRPSYEINVPRGSRELLLASLDQLPRTRLPEARVARSRHRVRRGETLERIARRYGTSVALLAEVNGIAPGERLRAGRLLRLPMATPAPAAVVAAAPRHPGNPRRVVTRDPATTAAAQVAVHIVRRGETLWGIARAYAVTPEELRKWNALGRRATLQPGQSLRVGTRQVVKAPSNGNTGLPNPRLARYEVKRGDTLWGIATAHGVSIEELRRWNDLRHRATLQPGQILRIGPSDT